MRTKEPINIWAGPKETTLWPNREAGGHDAQLWYTFATALELFLEDEWDGEYPYTDFWIRRFVQVAPGKYRVTANEAMKTGPLGPQVQYLLECDSDGSAFVQYA